MSEMNYNVGMLPYTPVYLNPITHQSAVLLGINNDKPTAYLVPPGFNDHVELSCRVNGSKPKKGIQIIDETQTDHLGFLSEGRKNWLPSHTQANPTSTTWTNIKTGGTITENGCITKEIPQMNARAVKPDGGEKEVPRLKARKAPQEEGGMTTEEVERKLFEESGSD